MATIVPIEDRTVHQIQSGQVIVDLCSVVKELVENGLDAGATSIEVRFRNQGLESMEVQDNGDGITPSNYETLALKHHTSKLSTYADLTTLQTFGFRGEALSSLCALSKFSVVTCLAQDAPKGTKLEFEQSGKLKGQSVVAAQKGTTVTVENLFHNLPVRKRELERNIKREWNRVISQLGQYACIQTGIKFSVTQQAGKGKKTTLFSTKGNHTTRENLVNVFGAKTLVALVPLDLDLELEPTSAPSKRWSTQDDGVAKQVKIVGHVSRPAYGEGRQTPDRQMFFVNARPCALPQFAKAFNEVYKSYNSSQSPFIFANIELDTHLYDVNVSPDKRTIMLHDQTRMLESLKVALTELFEKQDYTVPISQLPAQKQPAYKQLTLNREDSTASGTSITQAFTARGIRAVDSTEAEGPSGQNDYSDEDDTNENHKAKKGIKAVSRTSLQENTGSVSLMSNWMNRNVEDRVERTAEVSKPIAITTAGLSKDKRLLIEKFKKESELQLKAAEDDDKDVPDSSYATTQSTQDVSPVLVPQRVVDFNARIAELQPSRGSKPAGHHVSGQNTVDDEQDEEVELEDEEEEAPIPSLQSPPKPPSSLADRFSATARSQRIPMEMATITIDGETTISPIGSPAKRSRLMGPLDTKSVSSTPVRGRKASAFGSRLSQRFSAPGTTNVSSSLEIDSGEDEEYQEAGNSDDQVEDEETSAIQDVSQFADEEDSLFVTEHDNHDDCDHYQDVPSNPPDKLDDSDVEEAVQKREEALRVETAIKTAEENVPVHSPENAQRANLILKGSKRKDSTIDLVRSVNISVSDIEAQIQYLQENMSHCVESSATTTADDEGLESTHAEEKLSLTITKSDFAKMRIVGQFNLGFILATRTPSSSPSSSTTDSENLSSASDLFIIDQHASDEKYNFERLSSTTILQSQPLVTPKTLDLTAMEEELVLEHQDSLTKNGFLTSFDESGSSPVGQRCKLLALPLSQSTTFNLSDLEELLSLLAEGGAGMGVVRPSKVRKMFAMRACRSSIMIGRTLTRGQMEKVVAKLGELDKPWNCPHGRPTMRHLCGLGVWDEEGWRGDVDNGEDGEEKERFDWAAYVRRKKDEMEDEMDEDEEEEESGYAEDYDREQLDGLEDAEEEAASQDLSDSEEY